MKKQAAIAILAILVLLGAVWFVWEKGGGEKIVTNDVVEVATTTDPATDTASTTVEAITPQARVSTEGWKTCRNEKYGYEFKYPGEWYLSSRSIKLEKCEGNNSTIFVSEQNPEPNPGESGMSYGKSMVVSVYTEQDVLKMSEDKNEYFRKIAEHIKTLLFGTPNQKVMTRVRKENILWYTEKSYYNDEIFVSSDNKYFYIYPSLTVADSHTEALPPDLEETILSTFKFLDN